MTRDIKVLLIYPSLMLMHLAPPAMALFSALLKRKGFETELFDTCFYKTDEKSSDDIKVESLNVRPFDIAERGVTLKKSDLYKDLRKKVETFLPDLIVLSVLEDTYPLGLNILKSIRKYHRTTVIVGGVFATFAPEKVINEDCVDMVCVGEGEGALVELCEKMSLNKDIYSIQNLWVKRNGNIIRNPLRKVVNLDNLPFMDFSIFEEARLLRPMAGKVYRMIPVETHRGCPFTCTFCNSPASYRLYKDSDAGHFFRKKSAERIYEELKYLVDTWQPEYLYFTADTFLAMSDEKFRRFADIYREFKIPFWIQTRAETITQERAELLKEINCHRIAIGIEHGNEDFRRKVIGRRVSNERIIEAFELLDNVEIPVSVNNIIGFPDETRELAFDTIKLNREIHYDTTNCYSYVPYHGAPLRDVCLEKGYITEDTQTACLTKDTVLDMLQFPKGDIMGLKRVFVLYAKLPESEFPKIKVAERFDEEGNKTFAELSKIYRERYFGTLEG